MDTIVRALVLCLCLLPALSPGTAAARSWCAPPLFVHEWGVQAFDSSGAPQSPTALPSWFHRAANPAAQAPPPVRHMQPDQGIRFLPVLHFYADGSRSIPVGIEVGFTRGDASVWYPQVDARISAAQANGPAAQQARAQLLQARSARAQGQPQPTGPDPTRQLRWDHLTLTPAPAISPHRSRAPVIRNLRAVDGLWVNGATESERFVFYEATTRERVALRVTRGDEWAPGRRHLILHNDGAHPVHDVFLTHRERGRVYVIFAPQIPAGRSAGFILEEHLVARRDRTAQTRGRLRTRLLESLPRQTGAADCVMMRDPAVPVESARSHRLSSEEIDVIDSVWGSTFFDRRGTTIVYREDTAYLDSVMPLSIYTDMHSFPVLNRAGLVVWNEVPLP